MSRLVSRLFDGLISQLKTHLISQKDRTSNYMYLYGSFCLHYTQVLFRFNRASLSPSPPKHIQHGKNISTKFYLPRQTLMQKIAVGIRVREDEFVHDRDLAKLNSL